MKRNLVPAWILLEKDYCFPRYLEKFPIFQGFRGFFVKYCTQRNCLETKMEIRTKGLYIFSISIPLFKERKKSLKVT